MSISVQEQKTKLFERNTLEHSAAELRCAVLTFRCHRRSRFQGSQERGFAVEPCLQLVAQLPAPREDVQRRRSRLYRGQNLQGNTRWKALDEIYKMYTLLHRSTFKISAKVRQTAAAAREAAVR